MFFFFFLLDPFLDLQIVFTYCLYLQVGNFINGRLSLNRDNIRMYTENRLAPLSPIPSSPCPARGCSPCLGIPQEVKYYFKPGDVVINGIFSLHEMGRSKFTCGELISTVHPLYLEAMIYAVRQANANNLLNGVSLGGLGIDDCMDSDLSTNFIMQVVFCLVCFFVFSSQKSFMWSHVCYLFVSY